MQQHPGFFTRFLSHPCIYDIHEKEYTNLANTPRPVAHLSFAPLRADWSVSWTCGKLHIPAVRLRTQEVSLARCSWLMVATPFSSLQHKKPAAAVLSQCITGGQRFCNALRCCCVLGTMWFTIVFARCLEGGQPASSHNMFNAENRKRLATLRGLLLCKSFKQHTHQRCSIGHHVAR